MPVQYWPVFPKRLIRLSAAIYNHADEYHKLADALVEQIGRESGP